VEREPGCEYERRPEDRPHRWEELHKASGWVGADFVERCVDCGLVKVTRLRYLSAKARRTVTYLRVVSEHVEGAA